MVKKLKKISTGRELVQLFFIIIIAAAAASIMLWAKTINEYDVDVSFNLRPRYKWLRPDESKPKDTNTTNCISKLYNSIDCGGDFIGYKKCGPCSATGNGICVELNGNKTVVNAASQAVCAGSNCIDDLVDSSCINRDFSSSEVFDGKLTVLKWMQPAGQKKSQCSWRRKDNSLPSGLTGDCIARLYSEANCGGSIAGYSNCYETSPCSTEGKGICVELGDSQLISYQSSDISRTIPPGTRCSLPDYNRSQQAATTFNYLVWKCDR